MRFQNSPEYRLLPIPLTVLTLFGAWYPEQCTVSEKRVYKCFATVMLILGTVLLVQMTTNLILTYGTDEFDFENIFPLLVFLTGFMKQIHVLYYRHNILNLILSLTYDRSYLPQNPRECELYKSFQTDIRQVTVLYTLFIGAAVTLRSILPMLEARTLIILPLDAWYPYAVSGLLTFSLSYFHQILSGVTLSTMHLCNDMLFIGLLIQLNCQIELLKSRLKDFVHLESNEDNYQADPSYEKAINFQLAQCIQGHQSIYRLGANLQMTFKFILICQITIAVPNIMLNIYILSVYPTRISVKYFMTFVITVTILMEMYMFCWYGNQIVLSSSEVAFALYDSNWTTLKKSTKKCILTTLTRTSRSILISAGVSIPLNLDSFIKIMKTSYSAFNLLQQTAAK